MNNTRGRYRILISALFLSALVYLFMIDRMSYVPPDPATHAPDYVTELVVEDSFGIQTVHYHSGSRCAPLVGNYLNSRVGVLTSFRLINTDYNNRIAHYLTVVFAVRKQTDWILRFLAMCHIRYSFPEEILARLIFIAA